MFLKRFTGDPRFEYRSEERGGTQTSEGNGYGITHLNTAIEGEPMGAYHDSDKPKFDYGRFRGLFYESPNRGYAKIYGRGDEHAVGY